jgi:hypothetical protein
VTDNLKNKSILFIGPKTFNYETEIIKGIERQGGVVDYFNDRPFESSYKKIILRLFPRLLKAEINNYFTTLIQKTKVNEYDFIFCIKLECFPHQLFKLLKKYQHKAKFIFYTWDSFANSFNAKENLKFFDRTLSFDRADAMKFGLIHRPLFFLDDYKKINNQDIKYDLLFIGSVHIHRYIYIQKVLHKINVATRTFTFLYVPSQLLYYARKTLLFPIYGKAKKSEFKFNPLSKSEIVSLFSQSTAILDYSHHKQQGLTMRTIEAIGASKKIVTNNKDIINYDFYTPENILVLEHGNLLIPASFLNTPYRPIDNNIHIKYSLDGWINEIFQLSHDDT